MPGAPLPIDTGLGDPWADVDASATLTRLGPIEVEVRGHHVTTLLTPAYEAFVEGG